jgi:predicted ester cyclase
VIEETKLYDWGIAGKPMPDLAFLIGDEYAAIYQRSKEIMAAAVAGMAEQQRTNGSGSTSGSNGSDNPGSVRERTGMASATASTALADDSVEAANKQLFHYWFSEVWNKGNYDVAYDVIDESFSVHGAGGQPVRQGPEGVVSLVKTWRNAFPDGQMTIDDLIAEDDLVIARLTWRGTHQGDFYGIAPTGKEVTVTSIGLDRIVGGKIVEGWGELDMLGMMQQMGAMPSPSPNGADSASTSDNSEAARAANRLRLGRLVDAFWNKQNLAVAGELFAPDAMTHSARTPLPPGPEGIEQMARTRFAAFPDLHVKIDRILAEGDRVAAHLTLSGTHRGPFFGVPPSGNKVAWTESVILRIVNSQIAESWWEPDMLAIMQQIGAVPAQS